MTGTGLFDQVPRDDDPAKYSEAHFEFLNRAGGTEYEAVRDLIEDWYAEYPDATGDLRARFRKHDVHQHAAAWWELYVFILFRRLGYSVTVNPGQGPDFFVSKGASSTHIECAVLFKDGSRWNSDSERWALDCIDAARNPDFLVGVRIASSGLRLKRSRVIADVESWLNTLDYELVRNTLTQRGERPSQMFDFGDDNWRVTLSAIPFSPDNRGEDCGRIGVGPGSGAFPVESAIEIRKILKDKREQGRAHSGSLAVAILNWTIFARPSEVEDALFGSHAVSSNGESASIVRAADGFWNPGPPPRGAGVSAVLFAQRISMSRPFTELPTMWLNPWAHQTLTVQLPLEAHTCDDSGLVFKPVEASADTEAIFGSPPDWPWLARSDPAAFGEH
ncbi:hypothetical protein [Mycobacterium sp. EPa45]|uniref:hypothetical protein n=1 Tax=Mycobacterium sp. EPa45 TaxID=1545728 RepID=UPI00069C8B48|nr:hypothetical protein [Mycobacterium sp. EPa45]